LSRLALLYGSEEQTGGEPTASFREDGAPYENEVHNFTLKREIKRPGIINAVKTSYADHVIRKPPTTKGNFHSKAARN
jgi:hypothetical protein